MVRNMNNDALLAGIKLPAHLTFNPVCRVNEGGFHDEACAHNYDCLRGKAAPLFPPGLGIDQMNTPEVALRLELQKRSLVGTPQDASGYPRPSEYWNKQENGVPRRSQYWATGQRAPTFQGQNFGASKYWDKPQQTSEPLKPSPNAYALGSLPEDSIAPQQPALLLTTSGLPAPAQSDQAPRARNLLGRIVDRIYGVSRHRQTDIVVPNPVRPSANPQASSQMSETRQGHLNDNDSSSENTRDICHDIAGREFGLPMKNQRKFTKKIIDTEVENAEKPIKRCSLAS